MMLVKSNCIYVEMKNSNNLKKYVSAGHGDIMVVSAAHAVISVSGALIRTGSL